MTILDFTQWLEGTEFASAFISSVYYPLVEGTHVLSLALSVGTIIWFDMRLLGVWMKEYSIKATFATLRPWIYLGFSLMFLTGILLFVARAESVWQSVYFRIKLTLLLLSLINILVYHLLTSRDVLRWDTAKPPLAAQIGGALSIALWFSVIVAGRLMAYNL